MKSTPAKAAVLLGTLLSLPFLFRAPVASAAFGISPPFFNADHLVKGATYSQTVYLLQDQSAEDLHIQAQLNINDKVKPWITIDPGTDFVIPQGSRQFPVTITVHVPQDADLTAYSGTLDFVSVPKEKGQVTIALGVQVALNIVVGNDVFHKVNVTSVRLKDIEEGWNPQVEVNIENQGNVPESFTGASYELLDEFGSIRLAYVQKRSGFPEVAPFSAKVFTVDFPVNFHLGVGEYWGNVTFYQNDQPVASQKAIFNVLPPGSIGGASSKYVALIKTYWLYEALGLVALIGAIYLFVRKLGARRIKTA